MARSSTRGPGRSSIEGASLDDRSERCHRHNKYLVDSVCHSSSCSCCWGRWKAARTLGSPLHDPCPSLGLVTGFTPDISQDGTLAILMPTTCKKNSRRSPHCQTLKTES